MRILEDWQVKTFIFYMFQAISSLKDNLSDLGLKKTDTD